MKRTIFGEVRQNNNTDDRLSELPDAILTHILSFLDTKYAVQTSSLSKRWINLWISVTNLNFQNSTTFQRFIDHVLTRHDNSISLTSIVFNCRRTVTFKCFENVVNYATSNGVKHLEVCIACRIIYCFPNCTFSALSLRTLKLKCPGYCRDIQTRHDNSISLTSIVFNCRRTVTFKCFENVVNYATSNGVKHLEVCIARRIFYCFPNCTFSALSLRTLKLKCPGYCRDVQIPFCLSQLQSFSLEEFLFDGSYLFSKCLNLVELSIIGCDVIFLNKLIISAPQLERLNISLCMDVCMNVSRISKIVLSSPKLTLFNVKAPDPVVLQTNELVHLKIVTIDLGFDYGLYVMYSRTTKKMLQGPACDENAAEAS